MMPVRHSAATNTTTPTQCTDASGSLYVIEYGAARLTKLSPEGKVLGRFGAPGSEDGQFKTPWGMAINTAGHIIIADTGNRRLVELVP